MILKRRRPTSYDYKYYSCKAVRPVRAALRVLLLLPSYEYMYECLYCTVNWPC